MSDQKFGLSLTNISGTPAAELIRIALRAGFSAVSPSFSPHIDDVCREAISAGARLQSVHAPFGQAANMWSNDPELRRKAIDEVIPAVEAAARYCVPVVVCHTWIGFTNDPTPTLCGLENHERLVRRAEELGVRIAYENTEGEGTLFALMEHFKGCDTVGYCWDSGHELCYNRGMDLLERLGDRLLMTHINDNVGITNPDGSIYFTDDLHLLPFDGKVDWQRAANRLSAAKVQEYINLELKLAGDGLAKELYSSLSVEEYVREAYKRAKRLADMI